MSTDHYFHVLVLHNIFLSGFLHTVIYPRLLSLSTEILKVFATIWRIDIETHVGSFDFYLYIFFLVHGSETFPFSHRTSVDVYYMRKRSREETGMVCGIWGNFAQSTLQLASQVPGTSNLYHCLHICGLSITIEGTIQGQRGQSIDKKIFIQLLDIWNFWRFFNKWLFWNFYHVSRLKRLIIYWLSFYTSFSSSNKPAKSQKKIAKSKSPIIDQKFKI